MLCNCALNGARNCTICLRSQSSFWCLRRCPFSSTMPIITLSLCRSIPAMSLFILVSSQVALLLFTNRRQRFTVGRPSRSTPLMFISQSGRQVVFPGACPSTVGPAAVGQDQQPLGLRVELGARVLPPGHDRIDGKGWGFRTGAD